MKKIYDLIHKLCLNRSYSICCNQNLWPVGCMDAEGKPCMSGNKIFPPTYDKGKYCYETRIYKDEPAPYVIIDSVQSAANRHEVQAQEAYDLNEIRFPQIVMNTKDFGSKSVLELSHRIFDAALRDSTTEEDVMFAESEIWRAATDTDKQAGIVNLVATSPFSFLFGCWESTANKRTPTKNRRIVMSEVFARVPNKEQNERFSMRIDPFNVLAGDDNSVYANPKKVWEWSEKKQGSATREVAVAKINHGSIPGSSAGGVSAFEVTETFNVIIPQMFAYRTQDTLEDSRVRAALVALSLFCHARRQPNYDLRSGCDLLALEPAKYRVFGTQDHFTLTTAEATDLYKHACGQIKDKERFDINRQVFLTATPEFEKLIRKSYETPAELEEKKKGKKSA